MIAAPRGLSAYFSHHRGTSQEYETDKPVIAFDDDGRPLVVPEGKRNSRSLILASDYGNYERVGHAPSGGSVTTLIPAGGWRVRYLNDDKGKVWSQPLIGWGLKEDGEIVPLATDGEGAVEEVGRYLPNFVIYHPDEEWPASGHTVAVDPWSESES